MNYAPPEIRYYFPIVIALNMVNAIIPEIFLAFGYFIPPIAWLYIALPSLLIYPALLLPIYWARDATRSRRKATAAACIGVMLLIGLGLPFAKRSLLDTAAQELQARDVELTERVDPPQSVALHVTSHGFEGHTARCEVLCLRLLFGNETRRFTAIGRDGKAMTYWLEKREQCPEVEAKYSHRPAVVRWASQGRCLTSAEGVDPALNLVVTLGRDDGLRTPLGDRLSSQFIAIREAGPDGRELLRQTAVAYREPGYPLILVHAPDERRTGRGSGWAWQALRFSSRNSKGFDVYSAFRRHLGFRIAKIEVPE